MRRRVPPRNVSRPSVPTLRRRPHPPIAYAMGPSLSRNAGEGFGWRLAIWFLTTGENLRAHYHRPPVLFVYLQAGPLHRTTHYGARPPAARRGRWVSSPASKRSLSSARTRL